MAIGYAECPLCEYYGPHTRDADGMYECSMCNTSWGTGEPGFRDGSSWLPQPPPIR